MAAPVKAKMRTVNDVGSFIEGQADMMRLLRAVEGLALPDSWIGAGFIRNAVWDALHGREPDCGQLNDVDVVFLDRADRTARRDQATETVLKARSPGTPWSVKNQARMHLRNGDAPYPDVAAAIARWPETATAIAARVRRGRLELLAPYGVGDLTGMIVRPTPAFARRRAAFARRLDAKAWQARWPRLHIVYA